MEIRSLIDAGCLAILPTGCTEQQGPHLPVDFDTWFAEFIQLSVSKSVTHFGIKDTVEHNMRTLLPRDLFRFEQVRAVELSPDGEWLAYEKVRAGDTGKVKAVTIFRQTRTDIWIVRVSGGKPTRITSGAETATGFFHPMWAPDGERLAFLSIKEEEIRLYMLTDARYCLLLPAEISFSVGTQLACTAGTAFSALSKLPARAGDTVVVFGLGPVGLAGFLLSEGKGTSCDRSRCGALSCRTREKDR